MVLFEALCLLVQGVVTTAGFYCLVVTADFVKQQYREQQQRKKERLSQAFADIEGIQQWRQAPEIGRACAGTGMGTYNRPSGNVSRGASIFSAYKMSPAFLSCTAKPRSRMNHNQHLVRSNPEQYFPLYSNIKDFDRPSTASLPVEESNRHASFCPLCKINKSSVHPNLENSSNISLVRSNTPLSMDSVDLETAVDDDNGLGLRHPPQINIGYDNNITGSHFEMNTPSVNERTHNTTFYRYTERIEEKTYTSLIQNSEVKSTNASTTDEDNLHEHRFYQKMFEKVTKAYPFIAAFVGHPRVAPQRCDNDHSIIGTLNESRESVAQPDHTQPEVEKRCSLDKAAKKDETESKIVTDSNPDASLSSLRVVNLKKKVANFNHFKSMVMKKVNTRQQLKRQQSPINKISQDSSNVTIQLEKVRLQINKKSQDSSDFTKQINRLSNVTKSQPEFRRKREICASDRTKLTAQSKTPKSKQNGNDVKQTKPSPAMKNIPSNAHDKQITPAVQLQKLKTDAANKDKCEILNELDSDQPDFDTGQCLQDNKIPVVNNFCPEEHENVNDLPDHCDKIPQETDAMQNEKIIFGNVKQNNGTFQDLEPNNEEVPRQDQLYSMNSFLPEGEHNIVPLSDLIKIQEEMLLKANRSVDAGGDDDKNDKGKTNCKTLKRKKRKASTKIRNKNSTQELKNKKIQEQKSPKPSKSTGSKGSGKKPPATQSKQVRQHPLAGVLKSHELTVANSLQLKSHELTVANSRQFTLKQTPIRRFPKLRKKTPSLDSGDTKALLPSPSHKRESKSQMSSNDLKRGMSTIPRRYTLTNSKRPKNTTKPILRDNKGGNTKHETPESKQLSRQKSKLTTVSVKDDGKVKHNELNSPKQTDDIVKNPAQNKENTEKSNGTIQNSVENNNQIVCASNSLLRKSALDEVVRELNVGSSRVINPTEEGEATPSFVGEPNIVSQVAINIVKHYAINITSTHQLVTSTASSNPVSPDKVFGAQASFPLQDFASIVKKETP